MDFLRPTRLPVPPVPGGELTVQAPPEVPRAAPVNPLARLLPVAMVVAAGGMMVLYFTSGAGGPRNPMVMAFPAMMVLSLIGTLVYGARGTTRAAELNQGRGDYLRYLDGVDHAARETASAQHHSSHWTHPDPSHLWSLVGGRRMWERRPADDDFCHVRVGVGSRPLRTRLVVPDSPPLAESDPVTSAAVRRLVAARSTVDDVPVVAALPGATLIHVDGDPDMARALVRAVLCQLSVLHGPDHLAIAAVGDDATRPQWEWLKWLPHHEHPIDADAAGPARMTYAAVTDAEQHLGARVNKRCVVVVDGAEAVVAQRLCSPAHTVLAVGPPAGAPTAASRWYVDRAAITIDDATRAQPDLLSLDEARACARRIAAYRPAATGHPDFTGGAGAADWPGLMGLGDWARLDPATVWRQRGDADALRVPIGVCERGRPVLLDIKEAAQHGMGPHGLCIGATGSGKSEFLRTLTLGMIAAHPPDRLNLILIDFKGGATFLGLDRAAHVSAVITNLADEAHLVARMKDALSGEVNRRQEALRAAGNLADLTEYQRARAHRPDLAPLPAVLIVVDEFSELLSQHPDFAELFVAIGRLGRSLGMHLLLASQRLDEGRLRGLDTHLSYRVCMKTFSASESRAVLGVPDAYHLPGAPGAAYLKTADGELTRFQTAYVSGPYPGARTDAPPSPTARVFTAAPTPSDPAGSRRPTQSERSVLATVLSRLAGHGPAAHRVWLPPLRHSPSLDAMLDLGPVDPLAVPVGLIDSPFEQRRDPLTVDFSGAAGNVAVIGGPRSGKSTTLRTVALALAATHRPRDVQLYCLDFGGGALSSLRALPHVGAVASRHEGDLVRRTVAEVEAVLRAREIRFREQGIDSIAEFRRRRAAGDMADPLGDVFLIVDGWSTVRQEFEAVEGAVTALAVRGLAFGVHVAIAASRWAEIRPALKDQLGTRIELRLGDPAESEMDRRRARTLADCPPGRGITRDGKDITIALPRLDGVRSAVGLPEAIAAAAELLRARHPGEQVAPVALLPDRIDRDTLPAGAAGTGLLLGLGERRLRPVTVDFAEQPHLIVLGEAACGKTATLRTLCTEIVRANDPDAAQLVIVDYRRTLLGVVESDHLGAYVMSAAGLSSQLPTLLERLRARLPGDDVTQRQLRTRSWWAGPEIYVVVDDYDLVAGAGGGGLAPLLDYLPHARDIGLHLVVARRSGGAARALFDPVLTTLRDVGSMGLLMSASPEEGMLLGSTRPSLLPPGRATLITRADDPQLVQVAWTEEP
jgi:S-DNA-T family DNA segregation ATPase FtsK/SpoIIIE